MAEWGGDLGWQPGSSLHVWLPLTVPASAPVCPLHALVAPNQMSISVSRCPAPLLSLFPLPRMARPLSCRATTLSLQDSDPASRNPSWSSVITPTLSCFHLSRSLLPPQPRLPPDPLAHLVPACDRNLLNIIKRNSLN